MTHIVHIMEEYQIHKTPFPHVFLSDGNTKEQLALFTKLFILTGLPWMSVCIHLYIHGDHSHDEHCNLFIEVK